LNNTRRNGDRHDGCRFAMLAGSCGSDSNPDGLNKQHILRLVAKLAEFGGLL
jgi:hypothetical protein